MSSFKTVEIQKGFYSIEQDFVRCFLFVGETEALLVDTGFGGGGLKDYVEDITKLPLKVVFTHADGDHVGDAGSFERRFMHPSEFDYYSSKNKNVVTMEPIWEGDWIDLGTYRFEVILIPGHTPGSIALLEKEKRFLVGGDSIQTGKIFMFGRGRNFYAFRESMKKLLQTRISEFDLVYASHNEMVVEPETINNLYLEAGKVMEGLVAGTPEERFGANVKSYETDGIGFFAE